MSHLLAFLSQGFGDRLHFIGGTALARTFLPDGRLSEDIDLIAVGERRALAAELDAALPRALARTYGRLTLEPALADVSDTVPAVLRTDDGLSVRVQLLAAGQRLLWPTERRVLVQRYRDVPAAELEVPTLSAFAASKTATGADRHAPRDLWDLWALSAIGAIDQAAADMYRRLGPTGRPPGSYLFHRAPSEAEWQSQLAGQTRLTVSAIDAALRSMRTAHGATTARQSKTILRGALQLAVMANVLGSNPVRDVQTIKSKRRPKGATALTSEQLRALLPKLRASHFCHDYDPVDPITLLIATGLRESELLGLL